jgi:hypothetical protein
MRTWSGSMSFLPQPPILFPIRHHPKRFIPDC